jgi:hypothetical protein
MIKPRKPVSVGAVVVWTIINPIFGLIALAVRNKTIRENERLEAEEAEEKNMH